MQSGKRWDPYSEGHLPVCGPQLDGGSGLSLSLWGQTMHRRKWLLPEAKDTRNSLDNPSPKDSSGAFHSEICKLLVLLGVIKVIWIWRNIRRCAVIIIDMTSGFSDHCVPDSSVVFHICLHHLPPGLTAEQQLYFFCFCNNQVSLTLEKPP